MRLVSLCFLVVLISFQCSEKKDGELELIAKARIATMNQHDLQALGQLFSDSARVESVGFTEAAIGPAGVREQYKRYFATSPDMKYNIVSIVTGDHSVVVEYTSTGTMNTPEAGEPSYMQGKRYTLQNCTRMNIVNGKIAAEMTYFDQVAFLRQVGFFENIGKK